ncbi:DUF6207 family protein [Streptomyces sp. NPDC058466]|uniref:DUF6207 family protein n=1 Tax=Streptomyces sp. NPDC058466 TaxID=3346512 RepID=UPI00364CFAC0
MTIIKLRAEADGRVMLPGTENCRQRQRVVPGMRAILAAHVAEPGLAVVSIAAADDATAFAIQDLLTERCAAAPADRTTRDPGEPASGCGSSSTYASAPTHSPIPSSVQAG